MLPQLLDQHYQVAGSYGQGLIVEVVVWAVHHSAPLAAVDPMCTKTLGLA